MKEIIGQLAATLYRSRYETGRPGLCRGRAEDLLDELLPVLIPALGNHCFDSARDLQKALNKLVEQSAELMARGGLIKGKAVARKVAEEWFASFAHVERQLDMDAAFIAGGDPAAYSVAEVMAAYPGFYAIAVYRVAHELAKLDVKLLPRLFCEIAHGRTGIDIHPQARIDAPFFIDHGTGLVIGATTKIGKRVKLYQGVTLGALSVRKADAGKKRHPTIEDDCVIYANTTILGGETVIGRGSVIGGNVWLTESVKPKSKISK